MPTPSIPRALDRARVGYECANDVGDHITDQDGAHRSPILEVPRKPRYYTQSQEHRPQDPHGKDQMRLRRRAIERDRICWDQREADPYRIATIAAISRYSLASMSPSPEVRCAQGRTCDLLHRARCDYNV